MSSSKTNQEQARTISPSSFSSAESLRSQLFSSPSSSSSSYIAAVNISSPKNRGQKRSKNQGRWFPTPRPRYNSDGKRLSQGSSYPYPSGGNRLPFVGRKNEEGGVEGAVEELQGVSSGGKDRENYEIYARDPVAGTELKKKEDSSRQFQDETHTYSLRNPSRACAWPLNRRSKRHVHRFIPTGSRIMIRTPAPTTKYHEDSQSQQQQMKTFLQERLEGRDQHDESEIELAQLDFNPNAKPPYFIDSFFETGSSASHQLMFVSADFDWDFMGTGNYSSGFQDHISTLEAQTTSQFPEMPAASVFASLGPNENTPFIQSQDVSQLVYLFKWSARYYSWSSYDTGPGGEHPATFVAGLKRSIFPFPQVSPSHIEAKKEFMSNLGAEYARLMRELSVLRELEGPLLRLLEATRLQYWEGCEDLRVLAVEEYDRLRAYRRILLERLVEVNYEMDGGLEMDQLSLEQEDGQFQSHESGETQRHWHHRSHYDELASPSEFEEYLDTENETKARKEARMQLDEYNISWAEIQTRTPSVSPSSSTALTRPISIPYPPIMRSSLDLTTATTTSSTQTWSAHAFFCHAFNLSPYLDPPQPNSPLSPLQLVFITSGPRESQVKDLTCFKESTEDGETEVA